MYSASSILSKQVSSSDRLPISNSTSVTLSWEAKVTIEKKGDECIFLFRQVAVFQLDQRRVLLEIDTIDIK